MLAGIERRRKKTKRERGADLNWVIDWLDGQLIFYCCCRFRLGI
jgi:hypothetical protein